MTYYPTDSGVYIAAEDYERIVDEWILNRAASGDLSESFQAYLNRRKLQEAGRLFTGDAA